MTAPAAGTARDTAECPVVASTERHPRAPEPIHVERTLRLDQPLLLDAGASLLGVKVAVRLAGPADAPVVAALGGISAHRAALTLPGEAGSGWWQRALGTEGAELAGRYQVLGFDWLGGAGDTTGPSHWPDGGKDFPAVSTRDQARLLARVLDTLGIDRLHGLLSASYGGMVAQHFAADHPERVERLMVIACAHRPEPMAVARRQVQKDILALAGDDEAAGVALARALAMTTYRSAEEFRARFAGDEAGAEIAGYLAHQGEKFARRFDREAYRRLMDSIDTHRIDPGRIAAPLDLLGFSTDELCPSALIREFAAAVPRLRRCRVLDSAYGHDAFLCEAAAVARAINDFLEGDLP